MGRSGPSSDIPKQVHRLARQRGFQHGDGRPNKSLIARTLGVSRQRVQDILQAGPNPVKTRTQIRLALRERRENAEAAARGEPLPHAGPFDVLDPTKVPRTASPEEVYQSYLEFCKLCPPPARKRHAL